MKKQRIFMLCGVVIMIAALITGCAAPATPEVINLKAAIYIPESHVNTQAWIWWLDEVEKRTEGRLKFEKFYGGSLLTGAETMEGIGTGVADFGMLGVGYKPGAFPYIQGSGLPFLATDPYAHYMGMQAICALPEAQENYARLNLKFAFSSQCLLCFVNSHVPIKSVEDFKDVKTRGYGYCTKAVELLGGSPVSLAYGEVYTALQTGVLDAAVGSAGDSYGMKWYEPTDYIVDMGFGVYIPTTYAWNLDTWNNLPNDIKQIIEEMGDECAAKTRELGTEFERTWLDACIESGCEIYQLTPEEIAKAKQMVQEPIIDFWVNEDPEEAELRQHVIDVFLEAVNKYEPQSTYTNPLSE